ncbi:MAG: crotonase/enoyl-CoA hydratase family protein, partial [Alphaproteobacteria bacterium]|nr:crotonase/enoyl-CoA hydratase family protein [Alphaproteobacteria bacterium]
MTQSQGARAEGGSYVLSRREGNILIATLNRAEKRNAMSDGVVRALDEIFSTLDEDIAAVVIDAQGPHFSAGLDLSELTKRDLPQSVMHSRGWHAVFEKIQFGRVPVIAALKGAVIGGGLELAAACHIRVAEPSAYYALPEGQRGIFVGGGGSVRLPRLLGVARMMDMMMTGRTYNAQEGLAIGIAQYLVGDGEAPGRALEIARKVAGNAMMTNFALIHALPRIAEADPATGYVLESMMAAASSTAPEAQKRLDDFLNKR